MMEVRSHRKSLGITPRCVLWQHLTYGRFLQGPARLKAQQVQRYNMQQRQATSLTERAMPCPSLCRFMQLQACGHLCC